MSTLNAAGEPDGPNMPANGLHLTLLPERLAVCKLPAGSLVPKWATAGAVRSITWTSDGTSVVCAEEAVPESVQAEAGWRALMVAGPLDFALTGILLAIAQPLERAAVSIFAMSTYDTDYVLVRESSLGAALDALTAAGHIVE